MSGKSLFFYALAAIAALIVFTYGVVWMLGERIIARKYITPTLTIAHTDDPAVVREGERLAHITGCTGCHGANLNGKPFGEAPFVFRSVTSNIPKLAEKYSDEDLARSIRHGVKPNGKSVIYMPSPSFYDMRNEDLIAILSFIRKQRDLGNHLPKTEIRILGRLELLQGLFPPEASQINHTAAQREYDFSNPAEHGEYLARLACSECHGLDSKGGAEADPEAAPDLIVATAYQREEFHRLLRSGEAIGGRDLRLMDDVARDRFAVFTDEEIDALHTFISERALRTNN